MYARNNQIMTLLETSFGNPTFKLITFTTFAAIVFLPQNYDV